MPTTTVVSAPGKVLVTGGYLVLDPAYSGTVVSTSSRFYTVVRDDNSVGPNTLRVRSPQFKDAQWRYVINTGSTTGTTAATVEPASDNLSKNRFVQLAIEKSIALGIEVRGLGAIQEALLKGLDVVIIGDNDFYSQRSTLEALGLPRTLGSLEKITPFTSTGVNLSDVHKTGLGSSAALITSLVSALLIHFSVLSESVFTDQPNSSATQGEQQNAQNTTSTASSFNDITGAEPEGSQFEGVTGRCLAHNLAQYVHCLAQGKIGSGFDIAAAAFGSQLYTRFDPAVLQPLMDAGSTPSLLPVLSPSNPSWNYRIEPFKLPPLTRIMLADVDAGSNTPSLVSAVLKWRKEDSARADALWRDIDQLNQSFAQTLLHITKLHDQDPKTYGEAVKYISSLQPVQWAANPWQPPAEIPIVEAFYSAHQISQSIRAKMREMGTLAGVPIEPPEQTKLLNTCVYQAGVIAGGVPGAGGFDAIWLLVCDPVSCAPDQRPTERIEHTWNIYKELDVSPLAATESVAGGARLERLESVRGLENAVRIA